MINAGKNAYALSVLKSMEMKIDGRNIADNRYISNIQLAANKLLLFRM